MTIQEELNKLISSNEAPSWLDETGYTILKKGYLNTKENGELETPKEMYSRICSTAQQVSKSSKFGVVPNNPDVFKSTNKYYITNAIIDDIYKAIWNGWLCPASPVLSNMGVKNKDGNPRGLPISCFGIDIADTLSDISEKVKDITELTSYGGGVGISLSRIRGRGTPIGNPQYGTSTGVVPWAKIYDSTIVATNQGSVRRGAASVNLDIHHPDIEEFLDIRRPEGDENRRCHNLHHCVVIDNEFMKNLSTNRNYQRIWTKILRTRMETGEPYIMYKDNINDANPENYPDVTMTNICTEIVLHTSPMKSFVCCLSSLNAAKYKEWKNFANESKSGYGVPALAAIFLNAVLDYYIIHSKNTSSCYGAYQDRAIGIGMLGWHSYLQQEMIPFESLEADHHRVSMTKEIKENAEIGSQYVFNFLTREGMYPENSWEFYEYKHLKRANSHLLAIAPTVSNAHIAGGYSPSIEPWPSNYYSMRGAKGLFFKQNKELKKLLQKYNKDTDEVWDSIKSRKGSVQHLGFLSDKEKQVFKTFAEINQYQLVVQAAKAQKYICQSQSLNLSFPINTDPKYVHEVHYKAWELGIKTLYYCRTSSVISGDNFNCASCEG